MRTELVIFDMDGLMFDTERIYYKAWQQAGEKYGYTFTWEIYSQIVARNNCYIEKVLRQIWGEALPYEAIVKEKRALADRVVAEKGITKKKGLDELLDFLEAQQIKKAVATSSMREKALRYLEVAGVKERFDTIICGDEVHESKPNPELFLRVAKKLHIEAEACMVLEDSRLGIEAAKRAGMVGVFIPDLVKADEDILQNASYELESLEQVIDLIKA